MSTATLTVEETAAELRVHKRSVYRLVTAGEIAWINVGTGTKRPRIRISRDALDRYLKSREQAA